MFLGLSDALWNGTPLPIGLGVLGAPLCSVHAAWDITAFQGAPGPAAVPVPQVGALGGARVYFQWALAWEAGFVLSTTDAARVVLVGV